MVSSFDNFGTYYSKKFPSNVPLRALQGFVITTAIRLIFAVPLKKAAIIGALAAAATLVEAVTRPIMRSIFPNHAWIASSVQCIIPSVITLSAASAILPWVGLSYKVSLLSCVLMLALNHATFQHNEGMVHIF